MTTIKARLSEIMKSSLKAGNKNTLSFARNLHAAVRKKEIDDRMDLEDSGVQKIIATLCKQRLESIAQFKLGNREDLVIKEEAELKFLQAFMPAQLSTEELKTLIESAVLETHATALKDIGQVMKVLLPQVQGRSDGKVLNQLVRERLSAS